MKRIAKDKQPLPPRNPRSSPADPADLSATEVARLVRNQKLSPVAVLEACLARVEARNKEINAVVTLNPRAMDEAKALERSIKRGTKQGPLAGVVVGIKDLTPVKDIRTTYGSLLYADNIPTEDALVVQRLRKAGAIILGKTNTPEFGAGANTYNEVFGRTRNPHDLTKTSGGSTGGGAAGLATGMFALAEGTDLGGSLRIPASFCGVVGLRPSVGLVPTSPSEFAWDTLNVSGPMARTAADVALMLQSIAGPSAFSPLTQPMDGRDFVAAVRKGPKKGVRVAYCADIAGIGVDPSIEKACRTAAFALRKAGARVDEIDFDLSFARASFMAIRSEWYVNWTYTRMDRADKFGANVAGNVKSGLAMNMHTLAGAEVARGQIWHKFRQFFEKYDHLVTPCVAVSPFPVEQNYPETVAGKKMETYFDWFAPTYVLSVTGLPAGSVPCGLDAHGMPVGLQIVGRQFGEEEVLALARGVEIVMAR